VSEDAAEGGFKMKKFGIALLILFVGFALSPGKTFADADEYDDSQSHPLRVLAYLAYPAAFLVEWTVYRPFHFLVSATPAQEAFFGHTPHPPILEQPVEDYGVAKKVSVTQAPAKETQTAAVPAPAERVKIVEVPVEKLVVKEVPKVVEVEKFVFPAVAFRFDSAELTDLGKGQVYLAAQRLKEKPELAVLVEGHTDNVGTDDYNQKLGLRRAQSVIKELVAQGIESNRMSATSVGETKPMIDQSNQWARAVNRRVEFQVNPR
jgi:outer membrane protein OmpA-like peptidoglycan-associated protein